MYSKCSAILRLYCPYATVNPGRCPHKHGIKPQSRQLQLQQTLNLLLPWTKWALSTPSQPISSGSLLYYPPIYCVLWMVFFIQVSQPKACIYVSSPPHMPHVPLIAPSSIWSRKWTYQQIIWTFLHTLSNTTTYQNQNLNVFPEPLSKNTP